MTRPGCGRARGAAERRQPTWTRYEMTWPVSCTRPWHPPTSRCGSATATEAGYANSAVTVRPGRARHHQSSFSQISAIPAFRHVRLYY